MADSRFRLSNGRRKMKPKHLEEEEEDLDVAGDEPPEHDIIPDRRDEHDPTL